MIDKSIEFINNNRACVDVIGVRGICDKEYQYYLDNLGISLNKAAKLADSAFLNGKNLIDNSIKMAWDSVLNDIRVDGFKISGVSRTQKDVFTNATSSETLHNVTINRGCDLQYIYINSISVKSSDVGHVKISIYVNGGFIVLYDGSINNETVLIKLDAKFNSDSIVAVVETDVSLNTTQNNTAVAFDYYTMCSEELFLCKYWIYLINAVMYKAAANILNASLFNDRYNDFIIYKKENIALRVAQLDSTLNLLNNENKIDKKGLYQLELENINSKLSGVIKNMLCSCCFECDQMIKSSISIP